MEGIMEQTDHKFDVDLLRQIIYKKTHDVDSMLKIAMVTLVVIIAIILVCVINFGKKTTANSYNDDDFVVEELIPCQDEKLIAFVDDYFKARTDLRYDVIFSSFNKSFKNEMFNEEEKEITNSIRYERAYIKSYDNIVIYTYRGMYLNRVAQLDEVKNLYKDVETRLEKAVSENEDLKLTYNSLRQYKMNNYQKSEYSLSDEILSMGLDPVKDKEEIDVILEQNKVEETPANPILRDYNKTVEQ